MVATRSWRNVSGLAPNGSYDFFDDFSGTDALLASRKPLQGAVNWISTGAGAANYRAGAGKLYSTGSPFPAYAVMQCSGTPHEVGGVFETTNASVVTPTIAILKDYNVSGFGLMWHANLGILGGQFIFVPGFWDSVANGGADGANQAPAFATINPLGMTLQANTRYRHRIFLNPPYADYLVEDMAGRVLMTGTCYEPRMSAVIGPWVFFEVGDTNTIWHEAYVRLAPSDAQGVGGEKSYSGLDATPIGRNAPAGGRFSHIHAGFGKPAGKFSVRYSDSFDVPTIYSVGNSAEFNIKPETAGFQGRLNLFNGNGQKAMVEFDGGFAMNFYGNNQGTPFLTAPANTLVPYFASNVGVGGSAGPLIATGTGTPEGAVVAPIGSIYLRKDGGASTTLYVKQSGAGNTGWIAK